MKNIFERKSIENLINGAMQNLHTMAEANTIIGQPITTFDGSKIIPISKVSVGYVVGGGEYTDLTRKKKLEDYPLAGGSGGGVSLTPVGFLISKKNGVEYIDIEDKTAVENLMSIINKVVKKFTDEKDAKNNEKN